MLSPSAPLMVRKVLSIDLKQSSQRRQQLFTRVWLQANPLFSCRPRDLIGFLSAFASAFAGVTKNIVQSLMAAPVEDITSASSWCRSVATARRSYPGCFCCLCRALLMIDSGLLCSFCSQLVHLKTVGLPFRLLLLPGWFRHV